MAITALPINASGGSPSYSARQTRQAFSALMMPGVGPLRTRSGFRPGGAPTVSVTASTWTVGPLSAVVDAAVSSIQAPYLVASDANATGSVTAADATNPRKDILYLQISDTDEDASGSRTPQILYLAGTAAASPTAPSTPARSLLIGVIDVPKVGSGSPAFTPSGLWTVAAGGIVPVASQAARDALSVYPGQLVARTDTTPVRVDMWNGTAFLGINAGVAGLGFIYVGRRATVAGRLASNFSAETTIFTRNVDLKANRLYRIKTFCYVISGAGGGTDWALRIKDGSTTILEGAAGRLNNAGVDGKIRLAEECLVSKGSDTTVTFNVTCRRTAGANPADVYAEPTHPFQFTVEDITPVASGTGFVVDLVT
ncbi:hypothetical protein ABT369_38920 [Dactylosporangium sp. NPDC000244]|uniref:hypothetical protein n=1 Tax=Dactylosporangium sp. NPDC000244 TaxID=3154365 RepID=UPI00331F07A9